MEFGLVGVGDEPVGWNLRAELKDWLICGKMMVCRGGKVDVWLLLLCLALTAGCEAPFHYLLCDDYGTVISTTYPAGVARGYSEGDWAAVAGCKCPVERSVHEHWNVGCEPTY